MAIIRVPFQVPSMIEVKLQAAKIGLPEREAEKFWYFHDAKGWKIGNKTMQRWRSALQTWKFNWEERHQSTAEKSKIDGAMRVQLNEEFKRCSEKMKTIRGQYGDHQAWTANDLRLFTRIKARWKELREILGIKE